MPTSIVGKLAISILGVFRHVLGSLYLPSSLSATERIQKALTFIRVPMLDDDKVVGRLLRSALGLGCHDQGRACEAFFNHASTVMQATRKNK